ncbi:MAG: ZIP family metal transporter [Deltaproteobacteria bacterium]|nr:ZIP family metal transporter [Deltaproteobacteria bacterium]
MTALWVSGATCVMAFGGGLLALRLHAYRGLVLAFCAGALVASALLDVVPEALQLLAASHSRFDQHHLLLACSLGFLCFYLIEHAAHHTGTRDHPSHYNHTCQAGAWGAAGIGVHSFFDGVAIGGAFQVGSEIGWVIALAVILHKFADGVSTVGVMLGTQHSTSATTAMLSVTALAPLVGTMAQSAFVVPQPLLALALGWFAGVFLYLGASSLLPTAHESGHSRWLPLSTVAGAAFIYIAQLLTE